MHTKSSIAIILPLILISGCSQQTESQLAALQASPVLCQPMDAKVIYEYESPYENGGIIFSSKPSYAKILNTFEAPNIASAQQGLEDCYTVARAEGFTSLIPEENIEPYPISIPLEKKTPEGTISFFMSRDKDNPLKSTLSISMH